ncbi:hypothetical protein AC578_9102 [Pseudocercospora eumusae]|uniref:Uncharacterized protein n=1 Tax=Pseudocercospora eumusae TaxID=321146 RepID=A0A139HUX2_9PEZI|nr:hypothetical protein AC578_9102 [Pseudocercospora eumusae]
MTWKRMKMPLGECTANISDPSTHKAQGLSLDKVIVHLDEAFDREQPYVALSRAKSLAGLRVVSRYRLAILRKGGKLAGHREVDAVGHFLDNMKCFQKLKATPS